MLATIERKLNQTVRKSLMKLGVKHKRLRLERFNAEKSTLTFLDAHGNVLGVQHFTGEVVMILRVWVCCTASMYIHIEQERLRKRTQILLDNGVWLNTAQIKGTHVATKPYWVYCDNTEVRKHAKVHSTQRRTA